MWSAQIKSIAGEEENEGVLQVTYQYNHEDGRSQTIVERISDPNTIKTIAQRKIAELSRIDAVAALIADPSSILGAVDLTVTLTDEQQANQDYFQKRAAVIQAKQDLDLGLIDQPTFDSIKADVVSSLSTLNTAKGVKTIQ